MNAFQSLLNATPEEKKSRGLEYTPREIAQQPAMWTKMADILTQRESEIATFLRDAGLTYYGGERDDAELILTGAGSSEFVGNAVAPALRQRLQRTVTPVSTTNFVTHPNIFLPDKRYAVLSFARSGNSPESMATYNFVKQICPTAKQIAITCNNQGSLANAAKADAQNSLYIELPEETNDKSLVMTSSFTTMAFTAICLGGVAHYERRFSPELATILTEAANRVIQIYPDKIKAFADRPFTRACFLGSGALNGAMQECHLKLQEMTEGQVVATFNSFVGLRHGPQVFVNKDCAVIATISSDPYVQQYELDMLRELKAKKQGLGSPLIICDEAITEIQDLSDTIIELDTAIDEALRVPVDVIVGQILGTFTCLRVGLKPDNPSTTGTINRVVQGVNIYPYQQH
ncbi:MAG: SIS domain-containing protein [Phycisphaerales bacterium]|nr:SIS domain-containing protein [Phycisphaerales bacterium]